MLALVARRQVVAELSLLQPRRLYVLLTGVEGFTGYASLFYLAGTYSRTITPALFQGTITVLAILLNYLSRGTRVTAGKSVGTAVTFDGWEQRSCRQDLCRWTQVLSC